MKSLECIVTCDGHANINAYAIDRSRPTVSTRDDVFVLWPNCPDENSPAAKAVMGAARKLSNPTKQHKQAAVNALVEHASTDEQTATDLVDAIVAVVEAAKQ